MFTPAKRKKAKLRLALTGPSGSGKSYSALLIAKGLGGKVAAIDTEKGSLSLYEGMVPFDVAELAPPYTPERYIDAIHAAEKAGYNVLIIDSATHEWNGSGGCLELVDQVASAKYRGNSWSAWNEITPRHRDFVDAIMQSNMHVIATMRSKTETAQVEENGKKRVAKIGMKSEQRDGIEYEFTAVLDLVHDGHYALASKDRTELFMGKDPRPITEETGRILLAWLESGVDAPIKEAPKAAPKPKAQNAAVALGAAAEILPDCVSVVGFDPHPEAIKKARHDARVALNGWVLELLPKIGYDKAALDSFVNLKNPVEGATEEGAWKRQTLEAAWAIFGELQALVQGEP